MSKTKAQLGEELDALRAVLAAIGEGLPPLPADPGKMNLYGIECASRLGMITAYAEGIADCHEDWLPQYAHGHTAEFRRRWARPLHYEPETAPEPPDFSEDAASGECTDYDFNFKLHGCELDAGHDGPHRDLTGHEWDEHRCAFTIGEMRCGLAEGHLGDEHRDRASGRTMTVPVPDETAAAIVAKAIKARLCHYCDIEPATAGHYCEACAPAVQMATGTIEDGTPVIVANDAPPCGEWARRFGPYCTATTVRGTVTYYCDQAPHSEGDHRSPGLCEDDPDVTWTDEPAPEPTLHERRLQAVRENSPAVQDGPYAYLRSDQ